MTHAHAHSHARASHARAQHSASALTLIAALSVVGCHDLEDFTSKPDEVYCGTIIGIPRDFQGGFLEQGQPPDLELALRLDTGKITSEPGTLRSNDATSGLCAPQALFQDAPLRAIPEVDHDVLSTLSFGEGHKHDFFAWVDSTCQGTMLSVVSLMKNQQVELRLFKPAPRAASDAPAAEKPGFAVFPLTARKKEQCGF